MRLSFLWCSTKKGGGGKKRGKEEGKGEMGEWLSIPCFKFVSADTTRKEKKKKKKGRKGKKENFGQDGFQCSIYTHFTHSNSAFTQVGKPEGKKKKREGRRRSSAANPTQ